MKFTIRYDFSPIFFYYLISRYFTISLEMENKNYMIVQFLVIFLKEISLIYKIFLILESNTFYKAQQTNIINKIWKFKIQNE